MELYKLKADARHFFPEGLSTKVQSLEEWRLKGIPIELLDLHDRISISYGKYRNNNTKDNSMYDGSHKYAEFYFTVHIDNAEHELWSKMNVSSLMDSLQKAAQDFVSTLER